MHIRTQWANRTNLRASLAEDGLSNLPRYGSTSVQSTYCTAGHAVLSRTNERMKTMVTYAGITRPTISGLIGRCGADAQLPSASRSHPAGSSLLSISLSLSLSPHNQREEDGGGEGSSGFPPTHSRRCGTSYGYWVPSVSVLADLPQRPPQKGSPVPLAHGCSGRGRPFRPCYFR